MTTPTLNLRARNTRLALLKTFADAIKDALDQERADHLEALRTRYVEEGTKSFDVKLPNGVKVAAISLSIPKATTEVTDPEALLNWAVENAPTLVEEVAHPAVPEQIIPAQPAWTEQRVDPKRVTAFIEDHVKPVDASERGPVVDLATGTIVEGITFTPEDDPKSFSVRFTSDGRLDIVEAYRSGLLAELLPGTPLPVIGGGESQ